MLWLMGGGLLFGFVILLVLRSDTLFVKYGYIEEGVSFRKAAREMLDKKSSRFGGRLSWVVIGGGIGTAVVALIMALLS